MLGSPAWSADPKFATAAGRVEHTEELDRHVTEWTRGLAALEVQDLLQAVGVPAGVVQTDSDLVNRDPQLAHSGFFTETEDTGAYEKPTPVDRLPLHFSKTPVEQYRAPCAVGADNVAVLGEWLAMSEDDVATEAGQATLR